MRVLEIETLAELDLRVDAGATVARGWHVQSVDLRERTDALAGLDVTGAVFLGCRFADGVDEDVRRRGGLVFPAVPDVPFDPYRAELYSPDELYAGLDDSYAATPDARVHAWSHGGRAIDRTLAMALHDHAVDDALGEYVRGRRVVGVMGGHAAERGTDGYRKAARLGRLIGRDATIATGGGPGAMEAANLGAWLSDHPGGDLDSAITDLAAVPSFAPDVTAWARAGMAVRARFGSGRDSLGVPTWFYGHEPPNVFADHVAKYFRNAIREEVLLRICRSGVVFLPGAAGPCRRCSSRPARTTTPGPADVAPMVLVGHRHWTTLPVWPLLQRLARDRAMAAHVHLVDDVDDVPAAAGGPVTPAARTRMHRRDPSRPAPLAAGRGRRRASWAAEPCRCRRRGRRERHHARRHDPARHAGRGRLRPAGTYRPASPTWCAPTSVSARRAAAPPVVRGLLAFVQLSDVHVVDHQSPARVEWADRYDDRDPAPTPCPACSRRRTGRRSCSPPRSPTRWCGRSTR